RCHTEGDGRNGAADPGPGHTGGVPVEGIWSGRDRGTSLPPSRTPGGWRGGRQVCDAMAEQGWRMEGDASDQLQPQPGTVGEVAADPSTQREFCARVAVPYFLPDGPFSCPFSNFYS